MANWSGRINGKVRQWETAMLKQNHCKMAVWPQEGELAMHKPERLWVYHTKVTAKAQTT